MLQHKRPRTRDEVLRRTGAEPVRERVPEGARRADLRPRQEQPADGLQGQGAVHVRQPARRTLPAQGSVLQL